jgi:hypothetical protein
MDICNQALSLLREQAILNIDDSVPATDTEKILNLWFDTAKKECIIDVQPTFAIKREKILPSGENISETKYQLPEDCLKLLDINGSTDNYYIENNYIYYNIIGGMTYTPSLDNPNITGNAIEIRYTYDNGELHAKNIKFNIALAHYIAYYCGQQITNEVEILQSLLALKEQAKTSARNFYFSEVKPVFKRNYEWKK